MIFDVHRIRARSLACIAPLAITGSRQVHSEDALMTNIKRTYRL